MRIGIVIPVYNRPDYFAKCIKSLERARIPDDAVVVFIDDASTDPEIQELITLNQIRCRTICITREENAGVRVCLKQGIEFLIEDGCDLLMNLDSDAIVRNDFIQVMTNIHAEMPNFIATGFNCQTRNRDGSERHPILGEIKNRDGQICANLKKSVGGIHMVFTPEIYRTIIEPVLEKTIKHGGNWDHQVCIKSSEAAKPIACAVPSVVQHIGLVSSMGHGGGLEEPDTADDFKPLSLPTVTLFGADGKDTARLETAAQLSQQNIQFGAVVLIGEDSAWELNSWEAYSEFMIKYLDQEIKTDHALVIQYDGYVLNWEAWRDEWLQYDYIGAPWWYKDGKNVGNGGFSLRSKKLISILATDPEIKQTHPEDHHICRTYRAHLEKKHGIKFAPEHVAADFSIEGWKGDRNYNGQFGFHGHAVNKPAPTIGTKTPEPLIINQFQGIGDILFSMELVREWIREGHKILWPVTTAYTDINKHFPEVTFIDKEIVKIDYNRKEEYEAGGGRVIPLRWAEGILGQSYKEVMRAKYTLYGSNWRNWRKLTWTRDRAAEEHIAKLLGIKKGEKYNLVNKRFRTDQSGVVDIKLENDLRTIEMRNIPGTTMLDWSGIIEGAEEIHTVHTAIVYVIDCLETTDKLHQYVRKPDERDFSLTDYLWRKDYHYHL